LNYIRLPKKQFVLNAGVIGMGVGEKHALAYQRHSVTNLKSVCDFNSKKIKELKTKFPDVITYNNDQSILTDNNINIVSIASYDNYHTEQILQAFESVKHVMAEKPLCLSREELLQIRETQKRNPNIKLSSNLVLRTNSRFDKFREDIIEGQFGEVYYLEGDYFWGRKNKLFGWRAKMDFYSIILGAAIHMIDLAMWLLNKNPVSVQAFGNDIATKETNQKYNSFAVILLKFEDGTIAKITGNGGSVYPHFHGLKIFGTAQTAIHDLIGAYYLDSSDPDSEPIPIAEPYPDKEAREKVIHSFVDSILDESVIPLVPQQDVYDVMSVCFAAEESMDNGDEIEIKYL